MEMTTSTLQSTMDPKLVSMNTYDDTLEFTLENLELSFANALRRTILSDIPVVCFKTYPEKENQCNIQVNTTYFAPLIPAQTLTKRRKFVSAASVQLYLNPPVSFFA